MKRLWVVGCVVIVAGTLAATAMVSRVSAQAPAPGVSGRYQIMYSPHNARGTYMIDTQTGRVWQFTTYSFLNGDPDAWDLNDRIDSPADYDRFAAKYGRKAKPATP